jgi:hypothetical protein
MGRRGSPPRKNVDEGRFRFIGCRVAGHIVPLRKQQRNGGGIEPRVLQKADNDLNKLARFTVHDLVNDFRGIGETKAVTLIAALELADDEKSRVWRNEKNYFLA